MGDIEHFYLMKMSDYIRGINLTLDDYSINKYLIGNAKEKFYLVTSEY